MMRDSLNTCWTIVKTALEKGLDMIAICDHNSARNVAATVRAAQGSSVRIVPGLEITSSEEVHVVGLFPSINEAQLAQDEVYARLSGTNDEEAIGYQVVVDEFDMVEDMEQALLIGATTLDIYKVVDLIHGLGGLAVASHVDRPGFGIFSQLGFVPSDLKLDALEISRHANWNSAKEKFGRPSNCPLIASSDAHYVEDIGAAYTEVLMADTSFEELRSAIQGVDGREIVRPCRAA
ncbi:MAG: histidinol phosphatase [Deltaproteobacteria bacterium]|nr:histidinol phosphatase [Deltaproteobacteria bacterium]